jgi:hypothetical protein
MQTSWRLVTAPTKVRETFGSYRSFSSTKPKCDLKEELANYKPLKPAIRPRFTMARAVKLLEQEEKKERKKIRVLYEEHQRLCSLQILQEEKEDIWKIKRAKE